MDPQKMPQSAGGATPERVTATVVEHQQSSQGLVKLPPQPTPAGGPPAPVQPITGGPRFPAPTSIGGGAPDGPPRFPQPVVPPPLRHSESRSQLIPPGPGAGPAPPIRPGFGPPTPQRGPPPRGVFLGRPPVPGGPQTPIRPPGPIQQQPQGPGPRPPGPVPNRAPFPPPGPGGPVAGPIVRPPDPRLVRPMGPSPAQSPLQQQPPQWHLSQQQQQQQVSGDKRTQLQPQMSRERMAEVEVHPQQRPLNSNGSIRNNEQVENEGTKTSGEKSTVSDMNPGKPQVLDQKNNARSVENNATTETSKNGSKHEPGAAKEAVPPGPDSRDMKEKTETRRKSNTDGPQPPTNLYGDSESIKGFDNGQRKTLTSARSSMKSPASSPVSGREDSVKKKTSFADQAGLDEATKRKTESKEVKKSPSMSSVPAGPPLTLFCKYHGKSSKEYLPAIKYFRSIIYI